MPILVFGILLLKLYLVATAIYGLILGFSAHVLIGVLFLIVSPLSLITGLVAQFSSNDVAMELAKLLGLT